MEITLECPNLSSGNQNLMSFRFYRFVLLLHDGANRTRPVLYRSPQQQDEHQCSVIDVGRSLCFKDEYERSNESTASETRKLRMK